MGSVEEQIRLSIPADPQYVRIARLVAASVADRIGFDYDQVEDLRIAVDELSQVILEDAPAVGAITITCSAVDDTLTITGVADWPTTNGSSAKISALSARILDTVVDEYQCDVSGGRRAFRLLKRRFPK